MSEESIALATLLDDIRLLRTRILRAETRQAAQIDAVRPRHRDSARNLVHYTELRTHDVRALQKRLSEHGLSSLQGIESQVVTRIDAILRTLTQLVEPRDAATLRTVPSPDGAELLTRNAVRLLGPQPRGRATRIMVTLPTEAATDPALVLNMLGRGMDIARINCAHDGSVEWSAMVANVRQAETTTGSECLISMDLGGPKFRTGPIQPGPRVLKIRPIRDAVGVVIEPALVWLGEKPADAEASTPVIPVNENGWAGLRTVGEKIRMIDARGSHRTLTVVDVHGAGCLVSMRHTVYFVPGIALSPAAPEHAGSERDAHVGSLPATEQAVVIHPGDQIVLSGDLTPAEVSTGHVHRIGSTLAGVFTDAEPGQRVLLDDGKIGGVITAVAEEEMTVDVRSAGLGSTKLRAEKGINLPDTTLTMPALTAQDIEDLEFVKRHADIVHVSFIRSAEDVSDLLRRLDDVENRRLGIVLKIETVAAFESLPQILLAAMRWDDVGMMIARGDLAVEAGFERMAEVQEEILWLCEAARVPVIWATQVLDTMARTGLPSRAEVTDAAMAERAECVMLNKGPFINEAITMLAGILVRMEDHTLKKTSLLRRLRAWDLDDD